MEKYTPSSPKLVRVHYPLAARHKFLAVFLACCYNHEVTRMFTIILDTLYSLQKPKVVCKECEHYYENGLGASLCVRKRKFHKDYTTGREYVDAPFCKHKNINGRCRKYVKATNPSITSHRTTKGQTGNQNLGGSDTMSEHEDNEFKDEIKEIIESRKTVFCPIINSMCRIDCEAFEMPEDKVVRDEPPAHSYISGGECTHFLLRKREHTKIDFTW